jgi:NAD(P)-dependent dehydrogenase (short-subunit alcohol dehydrogenase family)
MSKFSIRALMRSLRHSEHTSHIRVNCICPWFTVTHLLPISTYQALDSADTHYATPASCALALLKLCATSSINGRALGVFPVSERCASGYVDLESDDYNEGDVLWEWDGEMARITSRGEDGP